MELSRRDFVRAALGAAVAASCRSRRPELHFEGQLLGPSVSRGHQLRDLKAPPEPVVRHRIPIVIVGGGPAGLSAAWRLASAGMNDFVLLELEPQLGGTSASQEAAPWGAHYVTTPSADNPSLIRLLEEMRVIQEIRPDGTLSYDEGVLCRAPQERLFYLGAWHEGLYPAFGATPQDLREYAAFDALMRRWAARRDLKGRRAFTLPVARCSDDAEFTALDRISMATYLQREGFRSERLRWWVDYACRDDYGLRLEETSAWAGIFYYASRLIGKELKAADVLTWPEGNGRLVKHLARSCEGKVRLESLVCSIRPTGQGTEVRFIDGRTGVCEAYVADQVICAVPKFIARRLVPTLPTAPSVRYGSWVVANVKLSDRPAFHGFPTAWDNVPYDSESLGYVVDTHQQGIDYGPTRWTWYLPLCGPDPRGIRKSLLDADWKHWSSAVVTDLARLHFDFERYVQSIDVWRWGHAMVAPTVGACWPAAQRIAPEPVADVHFAHTDLSSVALFEEAHYHGVRAAEEVLAKRQIRFVSFNG